MQCDFGWSQKYDSFSRSQIPLRDYRLSLLFYLITFSSLSPTSHLSLTSLSSHSSLTHLSLISHLTLLLCLYSQVSIQDPFLIVATLRLRPIFYPMELRLNTPQAKSPYLSHPLILSPPSLKRTAGKTYVIYDNMSKDEFMNWWVNTQASVDTPSTFWDGKGQRADVWNEFDQVSHFTTGQPMVMCRHCSAIFGHPNYIATSKEGKIGKPGTNSLRRHLQGKSCKMKRNPSIQLLFR